MPRLIDAENLWKAITTRIEEFCDLAELIEIIETQPTIDAVPVRHGKWKKTPSNWGSMFECSECGEKAVETVMGKPRFIYCPMCGAKMDGERKEE